MVTASSLDESEGQNDRLMEAVRTISGRYEAGYTCYSLAGVHLETKTCGVVHETLLRAERHAFALNGSLGCVWSPGLMFRQER